MNVNTLNMNSFGENNNHHLLSFPGKIPRPKFICGVNFGGKHHQIQNTFNYDERMTPSPDYCVENSSGMMIGGGDLSMNSNSSNSSSSSPMNMNGGGGSPVFTIAMSDNSTNGKVNSDNDLTNITNRLNKL